MSDIAPDQLLESVVRITRERTRDSLEASLVSSLFDVLPLEEVALLRCTPHSPGYLEEVIRINRTDLPQDLNAVAHAGDTRRVVLDPLAERCLSESAQIVEGAEGTDELVRNLVPINLEGKTVAILEVWCRGCPLGEQKVIRGLLRIYENYLAVLSDSEHDTLTGLLNRKTFDNRISRILTRQRERDGIPPGEERRHPHEHAHHWLGILDIDHFKRINDNFGHLYGDEVLLLLAQIMRHSFRNNDVMFRYGGEEFVVVLAPTDKENAMAVFDRFREAVAGYDFPQVGRVTVSVGVVRISSDDLPSEVVGRADQALYYGKTHGRNRVCNFQDLVDAGELRPAGRTVDVELFN